MIKIAPILGLLTALVAWPALAQDINNPQTNASALTSGTVAAARGGAGAVNGVLSGNGSGTVSQGATAGLSDVTAPTSWTPTDGSGASLTFTAVSARYTKIGNIVFAYGSVTYPSTADTNSATIAGFPVTVPNNNYAKGGCQIYSNAAGQTVKNLVLNANGTSGIITGTSGAALTNANLSTAQIIFFCPYPAS